MSDNAFDERVEHAIERFRPTNIRSEWDSLSRHDKGKRLQRLGDGIYCGLVVGLFVLVVGGLVLFITQMAWLMYAFPDPEHPQIAIWIPLMVDGIELILLGPLALKLVGNKLRTDSFFKEK